MPRFSFVLPLLLAPLGAQAAEPTSDAPASADAGPGGFALKSGDGRYTLKLGGYLHADLRYHPSGDDTAYVDTFLVRRARTQVDVALGPYLAARLMPDFGDGKASIQDAYLDFTPVTGLTFRAGKLKSPFGLERLRSATALLFIERAFPTALAPNRDGGLIATVDPWKGAVALTVGVLNGAPDGGSLDIDSSDAKTIVGRLFAHPLRATGSDAVKDLGMGAAITYDEDKLRLTGQLQWAVGRFGVLGEYVVVQDETGGIEAEHSAWQGAASVLLTDDLANHGNVKPQSPFDPAGAGGWGAFELAARATGQKLEGSGDTLAFAGGLNWYLDANFKLQANYELTQHEPETGPAPEDKHFVGARGQVRF